jgi:hypothetical protein
VENTRVGIKYLQVGANKAVLEALSQEQDTEYRDALAEFKRGEATRASTLVKYSPFIQLTRNS